MKSQISYASRKYLEAIIKKRNKYDIDKQQLVVEILTKVFLLSPGEQYQVNQQISVFFDNGQIKGVKNWLSLFRAGGKILTNKIL